MKLTHHGHACIEIDVDDTKVLIDPGTFSDFGQVRGANAILITHQHPDHLDPDKVDELRSNNPDAAWFADPQTAQQLRKKNVEVTATSAGESWTVGPLQLTGVGATHAEIHPYIDRIDNVGIVMQADGEPRLFHPGDSLEGRPADIDYLCVPVSAPWSAVKDTIAFVRAVAPKRLIPIHDGTTSEAGRSMYLNHIGNYGLDGGIEVVDIPRGESRDLS